MELRAKLKSAICVPYSLGKRMCWWHIDLLSASYYAAEFPYSQFETDDEDDSDDPKAPENVIQPKPVVLQLVTKTRGGQQYYQSKETMAWDLSHSDVLNDRRIVMCNSSHDLSLEEAQGRNRTLSIQRKAYSGFIILILAFVIEGAFGLDISIFTSGASEINIEVPQTDQAIEVSE